MNASIAVMLSHSTHLAIQRPCLATLMTAYTTGANLGRPRLHVPVAPSVTSSGPSMDEIDMLTARTCAMCT